MAAIAGTAPPAAVNSDSTDVTFVSLTHKPTARIATRYIPAPFNSSSTKPTTLVVFLNGLMTTISSWVQVVDQLLPLLPTDNNISLLLYDRYGQDRSDKDPSDINALDPSHGHNTLSSATDLSYLINHFAPSKTTQVVLVGNSIGCGIARLFAQHHPSRAPVALLLLDSVLANINMVTLYPDPDGANFNPSTLPEGITEIGLRKTRGFMSKVFDPAVGSVEGLSRKDLASLLPHADGPVLPGRPKVTVVGHGVERFAEESERAGMDATVTKTYLQPFWERYNEGLLQITDDGDGRRGPIEAVGAGHFIQRDRPDLVVVELMTLLKKIGAV
ncbi:hypothetical protein K461DRAFT_230204 [Myriangium duriaei CBS 260.36]|uniref:AB hydrolase-1 domain-containing protein n=1 Tax=Myriangium duriaei CBS 260.36 TaxID=1168546 RepID=A0A9P4MJJ3_9PEZI|nr:hypothetical protein K461DRAFT_230204 [Myriangium duriaei CBS 260.36]